MADDSLAGAGNSERLQAETAWLLRVRDGGDAAAFDLLFDALSPRVYGYLLRSGGCNPADGENLLQEIWTIVWTKARLFDPARAAARTWIFAIARNALIELKRQEKRELRAFEAYHAEQNLAGDLRDAQVGLAGPADGEKAAAMLETLAPEQARILLMAYVEGKSHRDIARELGLPVGTVKSRIRLGFQHLRALLESTTPGSVAP